MHCSQHAKCSRLPMSSMSWWRTINSVTSFLIVLPSAVYVVTRKLKTDKIGKYFLVFWQHSSQYSNYDKPSAEQIKDYASRHISIWLLSLIFLQFSSVLTPVCSALRCRLISWLVDCFRMVTVSLITTENNDSFFKLLRGTWLQLCKKHPWENIMTSCFLCNHY